MFPLGVTSTALAAVSPVRRSSPAGTSRKCKTGDAPLGHVARPSGGGRTATEEEVDGRGVRRIVDEGGRSEAGLVFGVPDLDQGGDEAGRRGAGDGVLGQGGGGCVTGVGDGRCGVSRSRCGASRDGREVDPDGSKATSQGSGGCSHAGEATSQGGGASSHGRGEGSGRRGDVGDGWNAGHRRCGGVGKRWGVEVDGRGVDPDGSNVDRIRWEENFDGSEALGERCGVDRDGWGAGCWLAMMLRTRAKVLGERAKMLRERAKAGC